MGYCGLDRIGVSYQGIRFSETASGSYWRFVSGYRFSDTASSSKPAAPLGTGDNADNAETTTSTTVGRVPAAPAPHPASHRLPRGRTSTLPHAPGACPETVPTAPV